MTAPRSHPSRNSNHSRTRPTLSGRAGVRLLTATVIAVVADLLVFAAASAAGATWRIDAPYDINAVVVAVATAVPLLAAGAIVSVLARRRPAVRRWAAWAGLGLALVSAVMPFVVSSDASTSLALAAMHLIVGAAWFTSMRPGHRLPATPTSQRR